MAVHLVRGQRDALGRGMGSPDEQYTRRRRSAIRHGGSASVGSNKHKAEWDSCTKYHSINRPTFLHSDGGR